MSSVPRIKAKDVSAWKSVAQTNWGNKVAKKDHFDGTRYQLDPVGYIRDKLEWDPWAGVDKDHPGQVEILDLYKTALAKQIERRALERGEHVERRFYTPGETILTWIRVESANNQGKCVAASEYITLADGSYVQAHNLIGREFTLLTMTDDGTKAVTAKAELNCVAEPVYRIEAQNGWAFVRNGDHPFFVGQGIFQSGKSPKIEAIGWRKLRDIRPGDLVAVAEDLPAFGDTSLLSSVEIKILAYIIGDGYCKRNHVSFAQQNNAQLAEFRQCVEEKNCNLAYRGNYDWDVRSNLGRTGRPGSNEVINLLRQHGVMGKGSRTKRVPEAIFRSPKADVALFLSRLYSTDGWASLSGKNATEIGYCSASEGLVRDVRHLLARFGIHGKVYYKPKVNAWVLCVANHVDVMAFVEQIGIFGKEEAIERVRARSEGPRDRILRNWKARPNQGIWRRKGLQPGLRWEKVVSVEPFGIEPTVAIEVPGYETFLTPAWEHNTRIASGIVNHFFDCFSPSIVYCFAPSYTQIHDLLFKEIKSTREGKGLPGRIMDMRLERGEDHFVTGKATSDAGGVGLTRVVGQHSPHILMVLDEAEGIASFVYDAVNTMVSGGIAIVLLLANPQSRSSEFYRIRTRENVVNVRLNGLYHPNVFHDREIVPGAVRRDAIELALQEHCQVVAAHDPDKHTFEAPWRPGVIYLPDAVFCRTVLAIPPADSLQRVLIPRGRYEEACHREVEPVDEDLDVAYIGIDVARDGADMGTIYCRWALKVWRHAKLSRLDTNQYAGSVKDLCVWLKEQGCKRVRIRIDNGGGYGGGVRDRLVDDDALKELFPDTQEAAGVDISLVQFAWKAYDERQYGDRITELYAYAAESLKGLRVEDPPAELESDLCDREYKWVNRAGRELRVLESKDVFRGRLGRSPDDGDGFVLAVAGDRLVSHEWFWC